jgi:hypothetical protein
VRNFSDVIKSGVSVREFCRREGVGESNFYAWRRAIAERDVESNDKTKRKEVNTEEAVPAFVPVVSGGGFGGGEIVLELDSGRRLRFDAETSVERVVAIVHGLESGGAA